MRARSLLPVRRVIAVLATAGIVPLIGILVAAPPASAAGTTWHVSPGGTGSDCTQAAPCGSIAAALGKAASGDTIALAPGSYTEAIDIEKSVTIIGAGATGTTVRWSGGTPVVTIGASAQGISVTLDGLTIDGGGQSSVGIRTEGTSTTTIDHSVVTDGMDGVDVSDTASVSVGNTAITNNIEYGIGASGGSVTTGAGTTITGNEQAGINIGGVDGGPADAHLTVEHTTLSGNEQSISIVGGTAAISSSTIAGGTASNLGVQVGGGASVAITGTTISGISSQSEIGFASGVTAVDGTATISDSTITGNVFGVISLGGTITTTNSTIAGNQARGVWVFPPLGAGTAAGSVTLVDSTVAGNSTAGGQDEPNSEIAVGDGASLALAGTVVDGGGHAACSGTVTDAGYNLISDATCGTGSDHTLVNTDPQLGPLADNGGPTRTMIPAATSPAVDSIPNPAAATIDGSSVTVCAPSLADQRGVGRPQGAQCDRGAVERAVIAVTASNATMVAGGPLPTVTPRYSGFQFGDTAADIDTPPTCTADPATKTTACSGAADAEYDFVYIPGVLTVTTPVTTVTTTSTATTSRTGSTTTGTTTAATSSHAPATTVSGTAPPTVSPSTAALPTGGPSSTAPSTPQLANTGTPSASLLGIGLLLAAAGTALTAAARRRPCHR